MNEDLTKSRTEDGQLSADESKDDPGRPDKGLSQQIAVADEPAPGGDSVWKKEKVFELGT